MSQDSKLLDSIAEADFVGTLFFSLVGREPTKAEKVILNAILVSSMTFDSSDGDGITSAMEIFKIVSEGGDNIEKSCDELVDSYKMKGKRIFGFGHSAYKKVDPRAKVLFDLARKNNLDIQFMNIAKQLEHSLEVVLDKKFVLNVDGAIAALLMTLGIDPAAGNKISLILSESRNKEEKKDE